MAIEKPYATYEYYSQTYNGTALDEVAFARYARMASNLVDTVTFGRVLNLQEIPDAVRDAVCAVAENYSEHKAKTGQAIKSESNDGYSVTFATAKTEEAFQAEAAGVIRMYLAGTGLLFRGGAKCCPWGPHDD